jgi:putative hydrolase of the HAD superfamily
MKDIKFVIWDMGGVIYDWHSEPFYKWCIDNSTNKEECAKEIKRFDFDLHMSGLCTDEEMAVEICNVCHIPYRKGIELDFTKAMMDGNGEEFAVTKKVMEYVIGRGAKNAMLSNASPAFGAAWRNDELVNNEHRFLSFNLKMVKPNPEIYKLVKDKLGVEFEELIFVDDREENVNAAIKLGINGIVFDESTIEAEIIKFFSN